MRRIVILALAALSLAGCVKEIPRPAPTDTATPDPATGGTCGDGRILRPGEQCP